MGLSEICEIIFILSVTIYVIYVQRYIKILKCEIQRLDQIKDILLGQNSKLRDMSSKLLILSQYFMNKGDSEVSGLDSSTENIKEN